jgi:hypothetical protein
MPTLIRLPLVVPPGGGSHHAARDLRSRRRSRRADHRSGAARYEPGAHWRHGAPGGCGDRHRGARGSRGARHRRAAPPRTARRPRRRQVGAAVAPGTAVVAAPALGLAALAGAPIGLRAVGVGLVDHPHLEVLDHRVGEQLLGHRRQHRGGLVGVAGVELDLEHLALPDRPDGVVTEVAERLGDRLALRIEDLGPQAHQNSSFHPIVPSLARTRS